MSQYLIRLVNEGNISPLFENFSAPISMDFVHEIAKDWAISHVNALIPALKELKIAKGHSDQWVIDNLFPLSLRKSMVLSRHPHISESARARLEKNLVTLPGFISYQPFEEQPDRAYRYYGFSICICDDALKNLAKEMEITNAA